MRLFVAAPVPAAIREKAAAAGREIAQDGVVPVRPENMHITLKFLGEMPEGKVRDVEARLQRIAFQPFECTARGVGAFPDENYVKVVWAGIESGGKLEALAGEVIGALAGCGKDERFSAHLTIARVKRKVDLRRFMEARRNEEFGNFTVSRLELVKSELGPGGPAYTVIAVFEGK